MITLLFALALQEMPPVAAANDVDRLEIGLSLYGTPVQPVDLKGKVVVWRTWAG
jgi:hypothetical protein